MGNYCVKSNKPCKIIICRLNNMKLVAKIPLEKKEDEINYLIIQSDEEDTKGFFLFYHRSLNSPSEADLWFPDLESAKKQATFNYGIKADNWTVEK